MQQRSNKRTLATLVLVAFGMFGFGFAMVPLYDVFCEITGLNGKTGGRVAVTEFGSEVDEDRLITVQFDTAVDSGLPWDFEAEKLSMKVRPGELAEAYFTAKNQLNEPVVGHAVPSVAPSVASLYFAKTECFCFTQQTLAGNEEKEMPVRFMVSPDLPDNVKVLTLSYRFYRSAGADVADAKDQSKDISEVSSDGTG